MKNISGRKIRLARVEANITIEKLADLIGINRRTIYMWESGKSIVPEKYLQKLSEILNKPIDYFTDENTIPLQVREPITPFETQYLMQTRIVSVAE